MVLQWTMSTDQNGRALFGNPHLIAAQPTILYVRYTPLNVDSTLPASWGYANGGTLFVQSYDSNFETALPGTSALINVNGAFDAPAEVTAATGATAPSYDPDASIPCLINGGCANATTWVRQLMDQRGATMAVVDYVRAVQPHYDEIPVGSGNLVIAQPSVTVSTRQVNFNGCNSATYYNAGQFNMLLDSTVSRFLVGMDGQYVPFQDVTLPQQSPSQAYSGTVTVASQYLSTINSYVINPTDPTNPLLMATSALPTGSTIAALTSTGFPVMLQVYNKSPHITTAKNNLQAYVYTACDVRNGLIQFAAGWQDYGANMSVSTWTPTIERYTTGITFTKGTPATQVIKTTIDPSVAACSGTATYDGNSSITVSMSSNCTDGMQLLYGNLIANAPNQTSVSSFQNNGLGSLFSQYCPSGTTYGSVTGDTWPLETYTEPSGGGTSQAYFQTPTTLTGCTYDARTGLDIGYYTLQTYGPTAGGNFPVYSGGTTYVPWAGICSPATDTPVFFGEKGSYSNGNYNNVYYTERTCVKPALSTWTVSW